MIQDGQTARRAVQVLDSAAVIRSRQRGGKGRSADGIFLQDVGAITKRR